MVKVQGPMFTVTAKGTVGDAIEFVGWLGSAFRKGEERTTVAYVRARGTPLIPMTRDVVAIRNTLAAGVSIWHDDSQVSAEGRNSWIYFASGLGMSGYNRYVQKFMENNPQRATPWNIPSPE